MRRRNASGCAYSVEETQRHRKGRSFERCIKAHSIPSPSRGAGSLLRCAGVRRRAVEGNRNRSFRTTPLQGRLSEMESKRRWAPCIWTPSRKLATNVIDARSESAHVCVLHSTRRRTGRVGRRFCRTLGRSDPGLTSDNTCFLTIRGLDRFNVPYQHRKASSKRALIISQNRPRLCTARNKRRGTSCGG
jgi:hypothetical protein